MSRIRADRIAELSTTTGTGAFTLAGALTGFRAFSAVCATGDTVSYVIEAIDGSGAPLGAWETGVGTYSGANTLTRTAVTASSNAGAAVNFAAGTKRVYMIRALDEVSTYSKIPVNVPVLASFTQDNWGTSVGTDTAVGITIAPQATANDVRALQENAAYPGGSFSRYCRIGNQFIGPAATAGQIDAGIYLQNSSNSRLISFTNQSGKLTALERTYNAVQVLRRASLSAAIASSAFAGYGPLATESWWLRMDVTTTDASFYISIDGTNFVLMHTESFATYLTAAGGTVDRVGLVCFSNAIGYSSQSTIYSYGDSAP